VLMMYHVPKPNTSLTEEVNLLLQVCKNIFLQFVKSSQK
jgi:hypothetical protein